MTDNSTDSTNPLKEFLTDRLPRTFNLGDGEMITGAMVLVQVEKVYPGDDPDVPFQMGERYEYTTSLGLPFATGRGMLQCVNEQLINLYQGVIDDGNDDITREDDEGYND